MTPLSRPIQEIPRPAIVPRPIVVFTVASLYQEGPERPWMVMTIGVFVGAPQPVKVDVPPPSLSQLESGELFPDLRPANLLIRQ